MLLISGILCVPVLQQQDGVRVVGLPNTARQVSLAPHNPVAVPQCALLNYMKFTAKHLEGIGLLTAFVLDFVGTAYVKWQHMKQSISFETTTSVLKHQGRCLAHNKAPHIEPGPACASDVALPSVLPHTQEGPSSCKQDRTATEVDFENGF